MIRVTRPSIDESDIRAVREVLESGFLVQGPRVAEFERSVADIVGAEHSVAVSSATAALHLALLGLGVGDGDIVLTTVYSWPATANVIELCGAQPEFIDICPETFNMDPAILEDRLGRLMSHPGTRARVKAVLPVHTFGQLAAMRAITRLAEGYELPVVEDAACALGADLDGRPAGRWGVAGCFSFHPRKAVTTGEGGVLTTDDETLAGRARSLRNHGQDSSGGFAEFVVPGFNYRMTDLQGALGVVQMSKLKRIIAARRRLADRYDQLLGRTPIQPPAITPGGNPVYQSYVALLPPELAECRARVIANLRDRGVETTIGTCHIPLTKYYATRYGHKLGDFPVADRINRATLTLPLYEMMSDSEQSQVVDSLLACIDDLTASRI